MVDKHTKKGADAPINPIYTIGPRFSINSLKLDTIDRNGVPMLIVAAHRRTFVGEGDYRDMLDHVVKLLNDAAGT